MSSIGLLVLSNTKQFPQTLKLIEKCVQLLYVHLDIPNNVYPQSSIGHLISELYMHSATIKDLNKNFSVNILIGSLKPKFNLNCLNLKPIDVIFSDVSRSTVSEQLRTKLKIIKPIVYLTQNITNDTIKEQKQQQHENEMQVYDNVVLGGTFDRIHVGHKIFLTHALLRARKRLVVGVTTMEMTKSKILSELILPLETRILELKVLLNEIDPTLNYEIVPIDDPFGPTKSDPNMDLIVVSAETLKGGEKVNKLRIENKLKPLEIYCVDILKLFKQTGPKEEKISSSNTRIDLLGTRLKEPNVYIDATEEPYIIGLTGGIACGKSHMANYLKSLGAETMDCDKIAHEIYEPGKVCYQKIVAHFGKTILDSNGHIDRTILGPIVFNDHKQLEQLNSLVWPELLIEVKKRIQALPKKPNMLNIVVIEAAVLLQANWDKEVHEVWSIIVPSEEAIKRIMQRNKLTKEAAASRLSSQLTSNEIVKRSHVVFSSQWEPEFTFKQAKKAWSFLIEDLNKKRCFQKNNL